MDIIPIMFDSMGARSMATFVKCNKNILIDPGVALGPSRYGLPPHPVEIKAMERGYSKIKKFARDTDIFVISHYHYDHYDPDAKFYKGTVFVKHPKKSINASQKRRAEQFIPKLEKLADVKFSDSNEYKIGSLTIRFSHPMPHGPEHSKLGWVIGTCIEYKKECFVHTSDVQGPLVKKSTDWIISQNPDTIFLCGVLSYFLGWRYPTKLLDIANKEVVRIMKNTDVKTIVMDHHLVRDLHFRKKIAPVVEHAKKSGTRICTAAEFAGKQNKFLEAERKSLWKK
ncbi:MAG: MBL fold metallo-hydrolase [Candidatus Diapherotrites archaeon]|nr:MBL fold metallo-hydrolase [Candidatus Diapherotrites archaeon]